MTSVFASRGRAYAVSIFFAPIILFEKVAFIQRASVRVIRKKNKRHSIVRHGILQHNHVLYAARQPHYLYSSKDSFLMSILLSNSLRDISTAISDLPIDFGTVLLSSHLREFEISQLGPHGSSISRGYWSISSCDIMSHSSNTPIPLPFSGRNSCLYEVEANILRVCRAYS